MIQGREKGISRHAGLLAVALLLMLAALPGSAGAATITPSTNADEAISNNGNCTLREAVRSLNAITLQDMCANTGAALGTNDTIALTAGTLYDLTLTGDAEDSTLLGDLDVLVDMTITGDAPNPPTIRGSIPDGDRVLHVANSSDLTLQSLIVEDGELDGDAAAGQRGANILFEGDSSNTLTLDDVDVTSGLVDTNAPGDAGGGIAADGGGAVVIQNTSLVQSNIVGPTTGNFLFGGGIYIAGADTDLTVSNSTIGSNDAGVGGAATGGAGGGIFIGATGDSVVNITNSTIDSNTAGRDAANPNQGNGGGIAAGFGADSVAITITGGSITDNSAGGGAGNGLGLGGGIFAQDLGETLVLNGVDLSDNEAGGSGGTGPGNGGGIYSETPLSVQNSLIDSNNAGFDNGIDDMTDPVGTGGGIEANLSATANALTVSNSTISGNRAGEQIGNGGGIEMTSTGNLSITDTVISGNQTGRSYGGGIGQGGGVHRGEVAAAPTDSILRSVIVGNSSAGAGPSRGGGVSVATQGTLSIRESTVSGNTATSGNASGVGGGLNLDGGTPAGSYIVENVTVHGNTANDAGTTAGGSGGGIAVGEASGNPTTATVSHSTIASNTAEAGGLPGGGNLRAADGAGSIVLRGSIVSGGTSDAGEQNCSQDALGAIDSQAFNVEGPPSSLAGQCGLDQPTDLVADPLLGAFQDNGGPDPGAPGFTQPLLTRAITTASPAFNRVTSGCPPPATDEIGMPRAQGAGCDSGAFELFVAPPVVVPPVVVPPATLTPPPSPTPTPKKKCKKKRKKSVTAAKKKSCKKKRK